jgi:hypothetical protein
MTDTTPTALRALEQVARKWAGKLGGYQMADTLRALAAEKEAARDGQSEKFWLELREPGCVPKRKGAFPKGTMAATLREFMRARSAAFITVVTIGQDGPDFADAPETLQMLDGRSMSTGTRNIETRRAAFDAARDARRSALEEANKALVIKAREVGDQQCCGRGAPDATGIDCCGCPDLLFTVDDATDAIRALIDREPEPVADGWRDIATAPKISEIHERARPFLGWCPDETAPGGGDWRVVWWEPELNGGCWYGDRELVESPTVWTDLPAAPTDGDTP